MAAAVKALFFDVFGTLVDWRSSIAREAEALLKPKAVTLDYFAFADAWRGEYQGAPWKKYAPAASVSASSIFCTGAISSSRLIVSASIISARRKSARLIWRGTGSTPGPMYRWVSLGSSADTSSRR